MTPVTGAPLQPCPPRVAVVGGGRWARVLLAVLADLLPEAVALSAHSRSNAGGIAVWAASRGLAARIASSPELPHPGAPGSCAVIVANAARDHADAAAFAIDAGAPVLVEKPLATSAAAAQALMARARAAGTFLAAAQVFLFTRYLERFAQRVAAAGPLEALEVDWRDPAIESRHGERKSFDATLPVPFDVLPHVVAIVGAVAQRLPDACRAARAARDGALAQIALAIGELPCGVRLERMAGERRRRVLARAGGRTLTLDFSTEPGTIATNAGIESGDPQWDAGTRPLAGMLGAFLVRAAGGADDARLDPAAGLQACRLAEQAAAMMRG